MSFLTVRSALSGPVIRVMAEMRPKNMKEERTGPAIYAVFGEGTEASVSGPFLGVVTDLEVSLSPGRIFADLVPRPGPPEVHLNTPLEEAFQTMNAWKSGALPVFDESQAFVGAVTRERLLAVTREWKLLQSIRLLKRRSTLAIRTLADKVAALERLHSCGQQLLGRLALGPSTTDLLQKGVEALATILQARYAAVSTLDEAGRVSQFIHTGMSPEEVERIGGLPQGHGLLGVVIHTGQALRLEDISRDPRAAGFPPHHPQMKTLLAVPISHRGRPYGRVYLSDKTTGEPFTQEDEVLASSFAQTISLLLAYAHESVERNRLQEALQSKTEQLQAVARAMTAFLEKGDWREASALIVRTAVSQTASEYGFVGVVEEGRTLRILAHEGIVWDTQVNRDFYEQALRTYRERGYLEFTNFNNLFGNVISSGKPVLSNDPSIDPRAGGLPPGHPPLRHFLGVPMLSGADVVGMIAVANRPGGYTDAEQAKMEVLSQTSSVLYDSYRRQQRGHTLELQLRQSQKMEAVGRLAGGVAHDFNNLLTVILGHSDLLLGRLAECDKTRGEVKQIRSAGERAASLTRQLLTFSRRQVLEPKVLDLNAVVAGMLPMLRRLIGEDIEITTLADPDLGHVKTDPGQIEQVIMNLAVNARDAMPKGGPLTFETMNVDLDEAYARQHAPAQPGHYVVLAVSDTGCGMDEETRSHIFEPFFTTKGPGKGTGLGLATVYGVVKQSGGYIWVYSEPGQGTTFKIYLPRVDEATETVKVVRTETARARGSETILLVEDEDTVRSLAREILEAHGYAVLEARGGPEALQVSEQQHEGGVHLLLTDVVMPGMNGRDVAERVVSRHPGMKVLYMSGYTANAIAHHGVLDVGVAYLQKPFTLESLTRKVREVLDAPSGT